MHLPTSSHNVLHLATSSHNIWNLYLLTIFCNLPLSSSHNIWNLNILTIFCNPIFSQIINFSLKLIVLLCWFSSTSFVIGQSQIKHEDMKIIMVIIDNLRQISNMVALACSYPRGSHDGSVGLKRQSTVTTH